MMLIFTIIVICSCLYSVCLFLLVWKTILRNLNLVQCLDIAPMEKTWFHEKLLFKVVIVMVKTIKYNLKDTMSIKIKIMHYMRSIRVTLPDLFEEFEVVYVFLATFCFLLSLSIGKRSTLEKIWGAAVLCEGHYVPR